MKAVIYARYSSDNQREESIEGQIDCFAKTYCRIHFCQSKNCLRSIPLCAQNSVFGHPTVGCFLDNADPLFHPDTHNGFIQLKTPPIVWYALIHSILGSY